MLSPKVALSSAVVLSVGAAASKLRSRKGNKTVPPTPPPPSSTGAKVAAVGTLGITGAAALSRRKNFDPRRSPINDDDRAFAEKLEKEGEKSMGDTLATLDRLDRQKKEIKDALGAEIESIRREFAALDSKEQIRAKEQYDSRFNAAVVEARSKNNALKLEKIKVMRDLHDRLLSESQVSKSQAKEIADKTEIDSKTAQGFPPGYSTGALRGDLARVHRLTGGQISTLDRVTNSRDRPSANEEERSVNAGNANALRKDLHQYRSDLYHEMAHHLEFSRPDIGRAAKAWAQRKSSLDNGGKRPRIQHLKKLTGLNYSFLEVAYEDSYTDPYVGKVYPPPHQTEVTSMGFQHFADPDAMARLWESDPAHFKFMLGVIKEANKKKK